MLTSPQEEVLALQTALCFDVAEAAHPLSPDDDQPSAPQLVSAVAHSLRLAAVCGALRTCADATAPPQGECETTLDTVSLKGGNGRDTRPGRVESTVSPEAWLTKALETMLDPLGDPEGSAFWIGAAEVGGSIRVQPRTAK